MKHAILFDMDGVILDSMTFHVKAWIQALSENGLTVDPEVIYLHEGAIEPATAVDIFCKNGCRMDEVRFLRILERQMEIFQEMSHEVRPYKGVTTMLKRLKDNGHVTALVTSSHSSLLNHVLPGHYLDLMECVITGDGVSRRKPHPDPYLAARDRLGVDKTECTVIENAPAGIEAARAAGMRCLGITTTLPAFHLNRADEVVESHDQLTSRLLSLR